MSGTRTPSSPGPIYDQKWMYWFWDWMRANRPGYVGTGAAFTGDVSGTLAAGTTTLALSSVAVAGTFGGPTVIPRFNIDTKGRVLSGTNAGTLGTFGGFSSLVGAGDLLGTTTTNTFTGALSTTGVAAGTYTYVTLVADAKGRITAATSGAPSNWNVNLNTLTAGTQTTGANNNIYIAGGFYVKGTNVCLYVSSSGRVAIR